MSKLLIEYILKENIVDVNVVEKLASDLVKIHGVSRSVIRQIFKDAEAQAGSMTGAYPIAHQKLLELVPKQEETDIEQLTEPFDFGPSIPADAEHKEPEGSIYSDIYTDEGFIDVLKYLAWLWKSKDRVRVLAKRFGVNPDLYAAAGLGVIPENPTDEDIWNTMDMSKKGEIKFVDSTWQPYYMDTLERLQNLPQEDKDHIISILEKAQENQTKFESVKLVEDLMILTENGMHVVPRGSSIKLIK